LQSLHAESICTFRSQTNEAQQFRPAAVKNLMNLEFKGALNEILLFERL
jgi:hypothetical protein